ncbi:fibronectin type III domain-containing protein [Nonomuraea sp. NPDC050790]|uniref:fibronectin type III domain-containing protein n=1 Tax=Nonomuraea sp. NPDC050790 TaxID=3364371 RepID=UPI0037BB1F84
MRTLAVLALALTGCAAPESAQPVAAPVAAPLTAVLTTPREVTLSWPPGDQGAAGRVVEFATEPRGPYTILDFVPPGRTTYTHPDLIPRTTFYYRLRPYYGPASNTVEVTLPPGPLEEDLEHDWLDPRTLPGAGTAPGAAPEHLRATVKHANGIHFTWTDRSADEEGYLLEVRARGAPGFRVAAVLDPDVNAVGLVTLPEEKRAAYRVRAFRYGEPSEVVTQTTG